jgi:predicted DNA-binding transcriptional regulator YafY
VKANKSQIRRLIELAERIRTQKQPVTCLSLATEWEVSPKTVQRDIDFLRDQLNAPLEFDRKRKSFVFTEPTWSLPALTVSEGEIVAILLGARMLEQYHGTPAARHLAGIFAKLAESLPDRILMRPEDLFTRFSFRGPPARPVKPENWSAVVRALCDRKTLHLRYRTAGMSPGDPPKESPVDPYHVANLQGEWYLFGVHTGRTDVRQFSMARFERAAVTSRFFELPPGFDPDKLLADTFGRFACAKQSHRVSLLFSKTAASAVAAQEWHPRQATRTRRDGSLELVFPAKGLEEVRRWVLSWGAEVRVLQPRALREAIQAEIGRMATQGGA